MFRLLLDNVGQQHMQHEKQLPSLLSLKVDPPEQLIEGNSEVVLPQVLEDVLALKNQRALELGIDDAAAGEENNRQNVQQDKDSALWDKDENPVSLSSIIILILRFFSVYFMFIGNYTRPRKYRYQ